jgi:hypothetical protein
MRDRASNGRYAFIDDRGRDFAAGIWVIDPALMIDLVHEQIQDDESAPAREEAYFAGARLDDDELRDAAAEDEQRRAHARARAAEATRSKLGLGHDIRAALIQPSDAQLRAVRDIVCRLLARHYGELIAYGAGCTDPERQRPVADSGRHEPRHRDAIVDAELQRALEDPDPPRGVTQLAARLGAASTLDPAGATRTKTLGSGRMTRKLRDALPGGEGALRASIWEQMRPMLSPALVDLNRDAFVIQEGFRDDRRPRRPRCRLEPRRSRPRRTGQRSRVADNAQFPPALYERGPGVKSPLCFGGTGFACERGSPAGIHAGGSPGRMGCRGALWGADGVAVGSGAHLSIASSTSRTWCDRCSLRRRNSKMDCQAVRAGMAPAGAKGLNGWLRVSMCQIASVSFLASSICATFALRWRPRRRLVRW